MADEYNFTGQGEVVTLDGAVERLAKVRAVEARMKERRVQLREEIARSELGQELAVLDNDLATVCGVAADWDRIARAKALDVYYESGNKAPHMAVKIKVRKVLEYDQDAALRYCIESGARGLLALDRGAFEVYARRVKGTPMAVGCVTVTEEVVATVARDLGEYEEAGND